MNIIVHFEEINVALTPIKFSILLEHFLDGFFDLFG